MTQPLAVITGATSGIGAAYAERLAADGYNLLLTGRREAELAAVCDRLRERYPVDVDYRIIDLAEADKREALVQEVTLLPRLDALINNAGYADDGRFGEANWSRHQALLDVHVTSTLQLTHAALPNLIRARGLVINLASVASWLPTPHSALYGPTKAFVRAFTETLALSYRHEGLRALAVCPGFTVTDFHARLGLDPASFYKRHGLTRAWSANEVVDRSLKDLNRGRVLSVQGWNYRLIVAFLRHLPVRWLHAVLARSERPR
ncbi:SDR family NAD(P)-dependent oxidoreductase [Saccharospirillum impatiens]|uniref:SDR family NAD(P)-dependent oxidoreductase n=1 Tax=Saccharospirillum impatiens TaxID=169438 RepID=UPI0003FCF395|nr:SDR family NAD(P)-dependent oxidoreductase [Saccharospirillum impatiens]